MPQNTPNRGYTYPLYTEPTKDFPAEIQELATDIDTDVTLLQSFITGAFNRRAVRISSAAGQVIPTGVTTTVSWLGGGADYDNGTPPMANLTATGGLALYERGVYEISAYVGFVAPGSGTARMSVEFASSAGFISMPAMVSTRGDSRDNTWVALTALHYLTGTVTDNITLRVWHNQGANLTIGNRSMVAVKTSNTFGGT